MSSCWEGAACVGYYAARLSYLVLAATQAEITRTLAGIVPGFDVP